MSRPDRLFKIMQMLRGGDLHRAQDIAAQMGVSERTIYRDMDKLTGADVTADGMMALIKASGCSVEASS